MIKYLIGVALLILSATVFSATCQQANTILLKIEKANGLKPTVLMCIDDDTINAHSDYHAIYINSGLLKYAGSRLDTIAFVIGHELGHMVNRDNSSNYYAEYRADKYSVVFTRTAGYNVCKGARLLLTFKASSTHPDGKARYKAIGC